MAQAQLAFSPGTCAGALDLGYGSADEALHSWGAATPRASGRGVQQGRSPASLMPFILARHSRGTMAVERPPITTREARARLAAGMPGLPPPKRPADADAPREGSPSCRKKTT